MKSKSVCLGCTAEAVMNLYPDLKIERREKKKEVFFFFSKNIFHIIMNKLIKKY